MAAIVVVAIAGFFRVDELQRYARVRRSALLLALVALAGVLLLGVLPGLVVAAALSLVLLIQRLSRPQIGVLAREPASGAWGRADRHLDWEAPSGVLVVRSDGPLFYANSVSVKERVLALARDEPHAGVVVLDLGTNTDLDLQTVDTLGEIADELDAAGVELRLAEVRAPSLELLRRSGLAGRIRIEPTIDAAVDRARNRA